MEQSLWRTGKNIQKKLVRNLLTFFFQLYTKNPSQIFPKDFGQICGWNIYWTTIFRNSCSDRTLSVTASGSKKFFKSPESLETSFFSWKIRLTTDKFSYKQIEKTKFFGHKKRFGSRYQDVFSNFGLKSLTKSRKEFTFS